jgi:hypothetical protein
MNKNLIIGLIFAITGSTLAWFQVNLQLLSKWWYGHPILTIVVFSLPTAFCIYFGWRFLVESFNQEIWTARFVIFSINTILFWFFAYAFKLQSLNLKYIICLILSVSILSVLALWPDGSKDIVETDEEIEEINVDEKAEEVNFDK